MKRCLSCCLIVVALFAWPVAAADFTLRDLAGKTHRLADYRGKWVLVNFWATWCPPCLEEIPDLIFLHDKHKDRNLVVIGVSMDEPANPKRIAEFADNMLISYPLVLGDRKLAAQFGRVVGLPTSFLYDRQGRLATTHVGSLTREEVERYIRAR